MSSGAYDDLADRLDAIGEELADLALERLQAALADEGADDGGDDAGGAAAAEERRITKARRRIVEAAALLRGSS